MKFEAYIWFRWAKLELNNTDLRLLDSRRPASRYDDILVEYYAFNKLGILDRSTNFLDDTNIAQVDVRRSRGRDASDGRNSDGGQR